MVDSKEDKSLTLLRAIESMKDKIAKVRLDQNITQATRDTKLAVMRKALRDTQQAALTALYDELSNLKKNK